MQVFGVLRLRRGGLLEVDVDVEAAAGFVGYGGGEGGVAWDFVVGVGLTKDLASGPWRRDRWYVLD